MKQIYFDFDSTLVSTEGIDELASFIGAEGVEEITRQSMAGEIPPELAYQRRLEVMKLQPHHLSYLAQLYLANLCDGAKELVECLRLLKKTVGIVSGGFRRAILPVAQELGIDTVYAVEPVWDEKNQVSLAPTALMKPEGKATALFELNADDAAFIGDGITDYATREVARMIPYFGIVKRGWVESSDLPSYGGRDLRGLLPLLLNREEFELLARLRPNDARIAADFFLDSENVLHLDLMEYEWLFGHTSRIHLIPGPTATDPRIDVACFPMTGHRSEGFLKLYARLQEKLPEWLGLSGPFYFTASSASALLEMVLLNLPPARVLSAQSGSFGQRFEEVARITGHDVSVLKAESGCGILWEDLKPRLAHNPEIILLTVSETSNGTFTDASSLAGKIREILPDALILADAVSAAGGVRIDDTHLDAVIFGSQKCLALAPGLGILTLSERYFRAMKQSAESWYLDISRLRENHTRGSTMATPPVRILQELQARMEYARLDQDLPFERHRNMAEMVWSQAEKLGLEIYAKEGHRSPTVTSIRIPHEKFLSNMKKRGVAFADGYGDRKGLDFRIGHMGLVQPHQISLTFRKIQEELKA